MKLLMLSGGLDSSYLAWKLIQEGETVHAHHVSLRNNVNPIWKQQLKAVENVLDFIKRQGCTIEHSTSRFDFYDFNSVGFDSDLFLLVAQKVAQNLFLRFDKVDLVLGWLPSDIIRSTSIINRGERKVSQNIWSALIASTKRPERINSEIQTPLITHNLNKLDILYRIPQELSDMTWSCRRPDKEGNPCGRCFSCIELKKAWEVIDRKPKKVFL